MKSVQKTGIYHSQKLTILNWANEKESHFLQLQIEPHYPNGFRDKFHSYNPLNIQNSSFRKQNGKWELLEEFIR